MNRMFRIFVATIVANVVFLGSHVVRSETTPKDSSTQTKELMNKFLSHMSALKKYMSSESAFSDPNNAGDITLHLKELSTLAKSAVHDPQLGTENYKISRNV